MTSPRPVGYDIPTTPKDSTMRRLPLLLLLALPLLLLACNEDGVASFDNPEAAIRAASERASEAGSFRFDFAAEFAIDEAGDGESNGGDMFGALFGGEFSMQGEGAVDVDNNAIRLAMDMLIIEMEMIQVDDECFSRSNWTGDLWQREECDDQEMESDDFFFGDNPTGVLDAFENMDSEIEDLGEEEVNGVDARRFRVTVNDPELGDQGVPVDIWVDNDGRPARIVLTMDGDSGDFAEMDGMGSISITFNFFDWGEDVDIRAPAEDEIGEGNMFGFDNLDEDDDFAWPDDDEE